MVRKSFILITVVCMACSGGEPETNPDAQGASTQAAVANQPPVLSEVSISPAEPVASDALTAMVRVQDPERDRVDFTVEWLRNGQSFLKGKQMRVEPGSFTRGDLIQIRVTASDGTSSAESRSKPIAIRNAPPEIRRVGIQPARAVATDILTADVVAEDGDGDPVDLRYRWRVDGAIVEREVANQLAPGTVKRKQTVVLEVMASDGQSESEWRASPGMLFGNAAPEITTQPRYTLAGPSLYRYKVGAKDPDGDAPLRYQLNDGPPGMQVDFVTGEVSWKVPQDANGVFPIELVVSDPYGAKTLQRYSLEVRWEASPAAGR